MTADKAPLHKPQPNPPAYPKNPQYVETDLKDYGKTFSIDASRLYELCIHHLRMNPAKEPK